MYFCSNCKKMKRIRYDDTLYEAFMKCSDLKCNTYFGKIEYPEGRQNPHYKWPVPVGTIPDPKVIQELGL